MSNKNDGKEAEKIISDIKPPKQRKKVSRMLIELFDLESSCANIEFNTKRSRRVVQKYSGEKYNKAKKKRPRKKPLADVCISNHAFKIEKKTAGRKRRKKQVNKRNPRRKKYNVNNQSNQEAYNERKVDRTRTKKFVTEPKRRNKSFMNPPLRAVIDSEMFSKGYRLCSIAVNRADASCQNRKDCLILSDFYEISPFVGVHSVIDKKSEPRTNRDPSAKYRGIVNVKGKETIIGEYTSELKAAAAVDEATMKYKLENPLNACLEALDDTVRVIELEDCLQNCNWRNNTRNPLEPNKLKQMHKIWDKLHVDASEDGDNICDMIKGVLDTTIEAILFKSSNSLEKNALINCDTICEMYRTMWDRQEYERKLNTEIIPDILGYLRLKKIEEHNHGREDSCIVPSVGINCENHVNLEDSCIVPSVGINCENHVNFKLNDVVRVSGRSWSGVNKEGGVGRVVRIHDDNTYDIKFFVGSSRTQRHVEKHFIRPYSMFGQNKAIEDHFLINTSDPSLSMYRVLNDKKAAGRPSDTSISSENANMLQSLAPNNPGSVNHFVRRSLRHPGREQLRRPGVVSLFRRLNRNSPEDKDLRVLRLKNYLEADTNSLVLAELFKILERNSVVQVLYAHNLEHAMSDKMLKSLTDMLKVNKHIWALNVGENFKVSRNGWLQFADDLKDTHVTHLYAGSESSVRGELKVKMRDIIRENREKHSLHRDPNNLDVILQIGQMWWNPKNAKCLKPFISKLNLKSSEI